jgi:hypothetical protein
VRGVDPSSGAILRAIEVLPAIASAAGVAPNAFDAQLLALMESWRARGAHRLDRDGDGKIDDPGAAIMDAAWPRIADAMMRPRLGPLTDRLAQLLPVDEPANPHGSSFYSGWYTYVLKNLTGGFGSGRYCGDSPESCRLRLWEAIDSAEAALVAQQGPDPTRWRADASRERLTFGFLPRTARWTNVRPFSKRSVSPATDPARLRLWQTSATCSRRGRRPCLPRCSRHWPSR